MLPKNLRVLVWDNEGEAMSKYIVRVELHHADYQDYEQLHAAMEKKGFARKVQGSDGQIYDLPEAEYFVSTQRDISEVRAAARNAAVGTGRKNAVLVTQSVTSAWIGLKKSA